MRRSRTKSLVIMVLAGMLAVVVLVVSLRTVAAQTPTPTPTPWPTFVPTPDGTSRIVWACRHYGRDAGPVCTWGDYFEVSGEAVNTTHGPSVHLDYPADGHDNVFLVPPQNTRAMTATCSYHIEHVTVANVYASALGGTFAAFRGNVRIPVRVDGGSAQLGWLDGQNLSSNQSYDVMDTVQVVWRLQPSYNTWMAGSPNVFESVYDDYGLYSRFAGYVETAVTGDSPYSAGSYRVACEIDEIELIDGSVGPPDAPTVGDWDHGDWQSIGWDKWQWGSEDPVSGEFDFSKPITGSCFTIIPQVSVTVPVPSILSYVAEELPIGWDGHQVCIIERELTLDWMDIDLAQMAYTWIMISVVWWMIGVVRRQ